MAAVTIHSDFRAQEEEICHYFHLFPLYLPWSSRPNAMILVFLIFSFKPVPSLTSFTLIKRFFSSFLLSAHRVISSTYLRLMFLPPILIPAYNSSSPAFLMMCSAYRLNKQGDSPVLLLYQSWTNQLFHRRVYIFRFSYCIFQLCDLFCMFLYFLFVKIIVLFVNFSHLLSDHLYLYHYLFCFLTVKIKGFFSEPNWGL